MPDTNNKLENLLQQANVPTLPQVAHKVVQLCSDNDADFGDFAQVIETDPGLSSRLLRMANSAYYGLGHKVTNIERAIAVLGLKHTKSISLGFHLTNALNHATPEGFCMSKFWHQSVLRGILSRLLAKSYCPALQEEAFLIGLLQDCGVPLLVQALGKPYAAIWNDDQYTPAVLYQLEKEMFEYTHLTAAQAITRRWELPELLAGPIITHHEVNHAYPSHEPLVQLSQIAYFVGSLSLSNVEKFCAEDMALLKFSQEIFGVDQDNLEKLLQEAKTDFSNMVLIFSDLLNNQMDISELLSQARDMLFDLQVDMSRQIKDLKVEVIHLRNICNKLNTTVENVTHISQTDELTGLAARAVLDRYVEDACHMISEGDTTLALLFADIDNFKQINDKYSHVAGDRTLVAIANLLMSLFPEDSCVARYGGDEFVVALLGRKHHEILALTKNLVQSVHTMTLPLREKEVTNDIVLSCSVGLVYCEAGSHPGNVERIQELADQNMYEAKRNGKNRFCYHVLTAPNKSNSNVSDG